MRIYVECLGDRTVGIPPEYAIVEMDVVPEERERIRGILKNAFSEVFDNALTYIVFEDERPANG